MRPFTVTDVRENPGDSAFLLDDGITAILYDTGFAFTGYAVADRIRTVLGDRSLNYIFLTHSHYDHALGSAYIRRRYPDVKIVAGEYAVKIFAKPTARTLMREMDRKFALKCGVSEYEDLIDTLHVDIPVKDGDVIDAGGHRFTAVNFPGHTKCSVGYYLAEQKLLLSSETLGVYDGENEVVPSYLVGYALTIESIRKAKTLEIEQFLLPHYGMLPKEKAAAYLDTALCSFEETANKFAEILRAGGTKEDTIAWFKDRFYHGYIPEIYPQDAMELNTGIMADLIRRELTQQ